ncbi:hypothetical protein X961_5627 [Burkholderia pseudomallei MSHR5613]|nr:hypothetical protein X948_5349 [Burkholderia pseudomallei MSHR5608]KGS21015.1 hypothetical protein X941_5686 [Burkholderia pseudomallei MSHR5569]KGS22746.1 hypothetical protein X962_5230 [Burkholderia pseudomallei MSHR7343]KGS37151.1 hypothetical protein X992_5781 [Burkholderia pseudomallei MSHR5492]KGS39887.1 hypothetical protein X961_5627 [Burkholderia pseudomallei MSHR5613]KGS60874.1 hypothetical protein X990_5659 [Burkholderia pseudomallei MSHR4868]KGS74124.1 hypothetical protein X947_
MITRAIAWLASPISTHAAWMFAGALAASGWLSTLLVQAWKSAAPASVSESAAARRIGRGMVVPVGKP